MEDVEGKAPAGVEVEVPTVAAELQDDVYDGLFREIISREVAHREGRPEGRSLVVELPEGEGDADFISYGQREMIDAFDKRLDKDKVTHRGIEVGRFPAGDADKIAKVRAMGERQVSEATRIRKGLEAKLGLPALPGVIESQLEAFEGTEQIIDEGGNKNDSDKSEV
ncbi:hypothetical protein ES703_21562 [subsurface metagenome]